MPSSIPYDSSLVLGNLVALKKIETLQKIADQEKPANLAQDHLNSLILNKHKLDMTFQEMVNMGVSTGQLSKFQKKITQLKEKMVEAAYRLWR